MTLKIDDCQDHVRMASLECHAVSSSSCSDDDAGHEPRDLGITSLLSAAAHIDPSKLTIKSSDIEEKEADFRDLSARRDVPLRGSNDEIDTAPKSAQSSLGTNKMLSTPHPRKRKAETSAVYDPNHLSKIIQIQPSPTELEAANTDRTMNALLSWYDRLRELHMFKVMYGHAEVPQQYPENHALGIVSWK